MMADSHFLGVVIEGANQQSQVRYDKQIITWQHCTLSNSAVSGEKRLRFEFRYRNDSSSYSAYTGVIIRHTLLFNMKQRHWQHGGWAQGNTLWMNVHLCQSAFTSHQYITAVESPESWVATETTLTSSFECPPGDTEGEQLLFLKAGTKSVDASAREAIVRVLGQQSEPQCWEQPWILLTWMCCWSLFIRWWLLIPLHYWVLLGRQHTPELQEKKEKKLFCNPWNYRNDIRWYNLMDVSLNYKLCVSLLKVFILEKW